jgi:exonuclease III
MNQNQSRKWKLLNWNVRDINSRGKWSAIRDKVIDSACDIICFQETKKEEFDVNFLKNVFPPNFDKFEFLPSIGASRGIITAWKSALFNGQLAFNNEFSMTVEFS